LQYDRSHQRSKYKNYFDAEGLKDNINLFSISCILMQTILKNLITTFLFSENDTAVVLA
jgi:hypothetical protein